MRFEEALKNYLKTSEWKYQKSIDSGFDKNLKDPVTAREAFDQLSGIGTGNLGLAGIIRNPAKSFVDFNPKEQFEIILSKLKSYNVDGDGYYLSEKSLPFLARNLVKYASDIGTEKDPIYELIKKGVYNENNIDKLSFAFGDELAFGELNPSKDYDRLKQMFMRRPEPNIPLNRIRKAQELPNRYYNTEPEKKALEEYYDRSILRSGGIMPLEKYPGINNKFGFLTPETANNIRVPQDSNWLENPFGHITDLTWKVKDAIDGGFLTESSLKNNRIGFKDFITKLEDFSKAENQPGYSEWKSTEPFLEVGPYSWHKLPYDEEAQLVEGLKMGNCAGDHCIARPGEKDIYSLRRTETNTPKVNFVHLPATNEVERQGGREHIKGLSNSTPKRKYFDAIEQLKRYLGIK